MPEEKEESSGFKVVDKRLFAEDGKVRDVAREEPRESAQPATPPQPRAAAPPLAADESEEGSGGFEGVVQFLGTTAMFQLGLMQGPGGERMPPDMVSAYHTIQMLEILQRKTSGNLTPEETSLLEDILYELRMTFVELQKRQPKKTP
jgi:Domain of unknown function (DUF1844)